MSTLRYSVTTSFDIPADAPLTLKEKLEAFAELGAVEAIKARAIRPVTNKKKAPSAS